MSGNSQTPSKSSVSQSSANTFFDWEKKNNGFILSLQSQEQFKPLKTFFEKEQVFVFVPQNVSLENVNLNSDFAQTHIAYSNPKNDSEWITLNGVLGMFDSRKETLHIVSNDHFSTSKAFDPLVDPLSLFESEKSAFKDFKFPQDLSKSIHVLREGMASIFNIPTTIFLLSETLQYEGCSWNVKNSSSSISSLFSNTNIPRKGSNPKPLSTTTTTTGTGSGGGGGVSRSSTVQDLLNLTSNALSTSNPLFPDPVPVPVTTLLTSEEVEAQNENEKEILKAATLLKPLKYSIFLDKLHAPDSADILKALKTFLGNFSRKDVEFPDQGSLVQSFLLSMEELILRHVMWSDSSEEEQEALYDCLEKFILSGLSDAIFSSHVHLHSHQNQFLFQRIQALASFVEPQHLDIKPSFRSQNIIHHAALELQKMNEYKTPRDKMMSIYHCCSILQSYLHHHSKLHLHHNSISGADEFLPLFIYTVLHANPKCLYSNIEFITHFRPPSKLLTELGYYFTNIVSAVAFVQNITPHHLTGVSPSLFHSLLPPPLPPTTPTTTPSTTTPSSPTTTTNNNTTTTGIVTSSASTGMPEGGVVEWGMYVNYKAEDLKMSDIPLLLSLYKDLYHQLHRLRPSPPLPLPSPSPSSAIDNKK